MMIEKSMIFSDCLQNIVQIAFGIDIIRSEELSIQGIINGHTGFMLS